MITAQRSLDDIFNTFLENKKIFRNKESLTERYTPETIPHRDNEIHQLATIFAPSLRLEKPSNVLVFGKTGTGKTLSVNHVLTFMSQKAALQGIPVSIVYVNCKMKKVADTEYRLIAEFARQFGVSVPPTGLPTDEVYNLFYESVDSKKQVIVLILDEIDHLISRAGDDILYNLTRINSSLKNALVSFVGISNDLRFTEHLDARIKSGLGEEEIIFSPYNALQLRDILKERALQSFYEGVIEDGVLAKCAAYAAREHGDARRALDLLRVAGELSEREASPKILELHIDLADEKVEKDRLYEAVIRQPKQSQLVTYAIMAYYEEQDTPAFTGDIYSIYKGLCESLGIKPLTQRRISDLITELDMLGIINAKVISHGRYGRKREITLSLPPNTFSKLQLLLKNELES
ncbi:cell division control protein Cdc6 [archaeon CG10_big_fil_rev_8_21_14_0_10_43_11]|nr:MAG: cell division control protein Cdc6 [archaeon CG10_big_fil_rev_8_21_14_0_10_43_11]